MSFEKPVPASLTQALKTPANHAKPGLTVRHALRTLQAHIANPGFGAAIA
jgi:hypothetical protein